MLKRETVKSLEQWVGREGGRALDAQQPFRSIRSGQWRWRLRTIAGAAQACRCGPTNETTQCGTIPHTLVPGRGHPFGAMLIDELEVGTHGGAFFLRQWREFGFSIVLAPNGVLLCFTKVFQVIGLFALMVVGQQLARKGKVCHLAATRREKEKKTKSLSVWESGTRRKEPWHYFSKLNIDPHEPLVSLEREGSL